MENMKEMYKFWLENIAKKPNGEAYKSFMIYVNALDNETYGIDKYNIYSISDPKVFCDFRDEFKKMPGYNDIDRNISHNALSASLNKYEEFLRYLEKFGEEFQKKYEESKYSSQSVSTPASKPAKKSEKRSNYAKDAKRRYKDWLIKERGLGDGTAAGYASALNRIGEYFGCNVWESLDQGLYEKIINDSEFKKIDRATHSGQCNSSIQYYWDYINESKCSAQSVSRAVPELYCDYNNDKTDSSLSAIQAACQSGCAPVIINYYNGDYVAGNKNQIISLTRIIADGYQKYAALNEQFNQFQDASDENIAERRELLEKKMIPADTEMVHVIKKVDGTLENDAIEDLQNCIPQELFKKLSNDSQQSLIEAKMLQLIPDYVNYNKIDFSRDINKIDFSRDIKGRISLVVEDELVNFLCRKFGEYCQNNNSQTLQRIHDNDFNWPLATAAYHTLHPEVDSDGEISNTANEQVDNMKSYLSALSRLSREKNDEKLDEIRKVLFEKITGCRFDNTRESPDRKKSASNLRNAVMHPNNKKYELDDYWKMLTDEDGIMQYCFISPLSPLGSADN